LFTQGKFGDFEDMQESLEIIKVKNLYKDEQKELKETEKVIARRNEDFEYKGTKSHDELGKSFLV
jgi:hypothetical protein